MEEFDGIEGREVAKGAVYPSVAKQKMERHGGSLLLPLRKFSCVRFLISAATAFEVVGEEERIQPREMVIGISFKVEKRENSVLVISRRYE